MKIIIEIPNKEIKSVVAKLSLATGEDYPEGTMEKIDKTSEIDITDALSEEKDAIKGIIFFVAGTIIRSIEEDIG